MRNRKWVHPDGKGSGDELGGVEWGETIIKIYYLRKRFISNKRKTV